MRRGRLAPALVLAVSGFAACSDSADPPANTPDAGGSDGGAADSSVGPGDPDAGSGVQSGGCGPSEASTVLEIVAQTIPGPTGFVIVPNNGKLATVVQSDDADASYISRLGSAATLRFSHGPFVLAAGKKIMSVNVRARARRTTFASGGGVAVGVFFKSRAAAEATFATEIQSLTTAWSTASQALAQHPAESRAWAPTDINDLEMVVVFDPASATNAVLVSYVELEVCVL